MIPQAARAGAAAKPASGPCFASPTRRSLPHFHFSPMSVGALERCGVSPGLTLTPGMFPPPLATATARILTPSTQAAQCARQHARCYRLPICFPTLHHAPRRTATALRSSVCSSYSLTTTPCCTPSWTLRQDEGTRAVVHAIVPCLRTLPCVSRPTLHFAAWRRRCLDPWTVMPRNRPWRLAPHCFRPHAWAALQPARGALA